MIRLRLLALILIVLSAVGIVYGVLAGEIQVGLFFFIVPYLYGSTALGALSILAVVSAVVILFVDVARRPMEPAIAAQSSERPQQKTEWGGVILVGPVPIVFGSTPRLTLIALAVAAAVLTAFLVLFLFLR